MVNNTARHFDIVIVGGGAVGAATACLLAKLGETSKNTLNIALLESQLPPQFNADQFDPRVAAITEKTRSLFEGLNIWQKVAAKRVSSYSAMNVWDAEGTGRITFDCRQIQQPNLGHIVENSALVSTLIEQIQQHTNIEVFCPAHIAEYQMGDDRLHLVLNHQI